MNAVAYDSGMKSELHQRGFLSVRKLLQEASYNDFDLSYDELGPHLKDGKHISITHSYQFCNNHQRPDGRYRYRIAT
jgi:hypothetical protein